MLMPHFELVLVVGRGSRTCLARAGGRVLEAITVISDIAQVNVPNSGGWTASPKPGEGLGMVTRKAIAVAKEDPSGRELAIEARWVARRGSKHQPPSTRHDEAQRE